MNQNGQNIVYGNPSVIPSQSTYPPYTDFPNYQANSNMNQSMNTISQPDPPYVENLFSMNHGKIVTVYLSYPDSLEWRDRAFKGKILASGRDYLLLEDEEGKNILLWLIYINYAIFEGTASY